MLRQCQECALRVCGSSIKCLELRVACLDMENAEHPDEGVLDDVRWTSNTHRSQAENEVGVD